MARQPRVVASVVERVAKRMEPDVARAFQSAVRKLQTRISVADLAAALKSGETALIHAAAHVGDLPGVLGSAGMQQVFLNVIIASGQTAAAALSSAAGVEFRFNAVDLNSVIYARRQTADLVVAVSETTKETIRVVTTLGQAYGLTVDQQARAIRGAVGLPPNWAGAPLRFADEIRNGKDSAYLKRRRISAVDRARIRKHVRAGTVTEKFVKEMQAKYEFSLVNRRAMNIARTETMRAGNFGQRQSWSQAIDGGALPKTARRFWLVTQDQFLRDTHAAVPAMNPDGVAVKDGVYQTPIGPSLGPPLETNCRCSEGLMVNPVLAL